MYFDIVLRYLFSIQRLHGFRQVVQHRPTLPLTRYSLPTLTKASLPHNQLPIPLAKVWFWLFLILSFVLFQSIACHRTSVVLVQKHFLLILKDRAFSATSDTRGKKATQSVA